jgi:hypothetical protein
MKINKFFSDFESDQDKDKLNEELEKLRLELREEFYSQLGGYVQKYSQHLILSETDRIKFFLYNSDEVRSVVKSVPIYSENTDELNYFVFMSYPRIKAFFNLSESTIRFNEPEVQSLFFELYKLKADLKNIENSILFLKELGSGEEIEVKFTIESNKIVFGKEEKVTKKKSICMYLS